MPSLKDLRNRIGTVKSTQKITKAMQMVAASKLRRAQEAAEAARPYADRLGAVLASLAASAEGQDSAPRLMVGTGADDVHLVVVCTADRGLCGGFNSSIVRAAKKHLSELQATGKQFKIICVGRKSREQLKREYRDSIIETFELGNARTISFDEAGPVAKKILEMFEAGEFDVCTLLYSHFKSVMTQIVTSRSLVPAEISEAEDGLDGEAAESFGGAVYDYEPGEAEILEELLPLNLSVQVLRALLENAASEQGARMAAMDSATRNAGEMIDGLTLAYNRSRQAQITRELIEIISGAEAI